MPVENINFESRALLDDKIKLVFKKIDGAIKKPVTKSKLS